MENQSGTDWKDVDLTLTSGSPVTFRQALYASYYVDRPEIPVEVVGRVLPRLEDGAVSMAEKTEADLAVPAAGARRFGGAGAWAGSTAMAPSAPVMAPGYNAPSYSAPGYAGTRPAESTEEPTQVLFHLPSPVTLASGQEGLLPVITRDIHAERVSLYQPDVDAPGGRWPPSSSRTTETRASRPAW